MLDDLDPLASGEARHRLDGNTDAKDNDLDPLASGEARHECQIISNDLRYLDPLASGEARRWIAQILI